MSIKAPSVISRIFGRTTSVPNHTPLQHQSGRGPSERVQRKNPGKQEFIHFVESIRKKFAPGDLVTFSHEPIIIGKHPLNYYQIEYIQELWYDCPYNEFSNEFEILLLKNVVYGGPTFTVAPSKWRKLTKEEAELVHAQHLTVQPST